MGDKRREDLEWLYGNGEPPAEETRVFSPEEIAQMGSEPPRPPRQRPAPRPGSPASRSGSPATAPQPRVAAADGAGRGTRPPLPPRGAGRPMPPDGQPAPNRRRRRRHPVRNTILVLVLAWLAFLVGTPLYAWFRGNVVDAAPDGERPPEQPGTVILMVGSDSREGLTREERARMGTGSTEGHRTDTIMLLYLPPKGPSAIISIPRDSYVAIPGHKKNKINAAYAWGGPKLLVQTIEQNTGIRVDGYLEVGLIGVVDTVDAVGGIEVCPEKPIKDKDSHLDLPAGCQQLDGVHALNYARMRQADPRGDLGRMERQREVIGKVAKKAINPLSVLNPVTYWKLNMAVAKSVVRSDQTGLGMLPGIVSGFTGAAFGSGYSITVPVSDANARTSAGSSMIWDERASAELFKAIQTGDTDVLEKYGR